LIWGEGAMGGGADLLWLALRRWHM
jgi:hypothetical protein